MENPGSTLPREKENMKIFTVTSGYDAAVLVQDLADWLTACHGKETELLCADKIYLVQMQDAGTRLDRLMKRKAESMHVLMRLEGNQLSVEPGRGRWVENNQKASAAFSISNIASYARDATGHLAESAASEVADAWTESKTGQEIFDFIADHISNHWRAAFQIPRVDPSQSRYAENTTPVERAWISALLESGEILIAWLETADNAPDSYEWKFMLTTRRAALATRSKTRFQTFLELPALPMTLKEGIGRDTVTIGNTTFRTQIGNDRLFKEIAPIAAYYRK